MKLKYVFTLCLLVGITFGAEVDDKTTAAPTKAPTTITTTSTTTTETPTTATTKPTSAPTKPTPTSPPSTKPTPTSPPSTTTTSPSTPAPTTTSAPPSSTPAPAPQKEWVVTDPKTNISCILARMEVTFNLRMGKTSDMMKISPATAKAVGGHCGNPQVLKVVWNQEELGNMSSSMIISFAQNKNDYFISGLNLFLVHNSSEGIVPSEFTGTNLTLYETSVNSSYSCESVEIPQMKNSKNETVDIKLNGLLIEAFRSKNTTSFSSAHYCSGEVPDIVPLVVGIALAALVLVVVIAYLIGRRRSQARGYLSM